MIEPYYQDSAVTLYHGDCREIVPTLGKFDLLLTDPPYGIGDVPIKGQGRTGKRVGTENTWHPVSEWDKELILPDVDATIIAWWGHWRKREEVSSKYGKPRCEIVWVKDCHVGPPCPAAMQDERMWVFSKKPFEPLRFETTCWHVPIIPTWAYRHHKNEKPIELMTRCLEWLPGDTILDPFAGSGTTGRAAKDLGRKCTMIEIEERYCEIAARRMAQEVFDFGDAVGAKRG